MNRQKIFLIAAAVGLIPIALSYGVDPTKTLSAMFGLSIESTNGVHIFRAVMGLYLALATFWILGAFRDSLTRPALLSLIVFMLGLAAGRALSLLVDGMPNSILIIYLLLEIAFGVVGILLLKNENSRATH